MEYTEGIPVGKFMYELPKPESIQEHIAKLELIAQERASLVDQLQALEAQVDERKRQLGFPVEERRPPIVFTEEEIRSQEAWQQTQKERCMKIIQDLELEDELPVTALYDDGGDCSDFGGDYRRHKKWYALVKSGTQYLLQIHHMYEKNRIETYSMEQWLFGDNMAQPIALDARSSGGGFSLKAFNLERSSPTRWSNLEGALEVASSRLQTDRLLNKAHDLLLTQPLEAKGEHEMRRSYRAMATQTSGVELSGIYYKLDRGVVELARIGLRECGVNEDAGTYAYANVGSGEIRTSLPYTIQERTIKQREVFAGLLARVEAVVSLQNA